MESFGWAVIGSGYIVKRVLREITYSGEHHLVSIYSKNQENSQILAKKYGGQSFADVDQAILTPGVQGVYIATPNSSHMFYLNRCLDHNIPILCEKPILMNSDELFFIIEKSEKKKTYFAEVMSFKYSPLYKKIKSIYQDKTLGNLKEIKIDIGFDAISITKRKYLLLPQNGGGALMDIGVYLISFVEGLLGYTDKISNNAVFYKHRIDIIDNMVLEYENIKCYLMCCFDRVTRTQAELIFENGIITVPRFFQPCELYINRGNKTTSFKDAFSYRLQFDSIKDDIKKGNISNSIHTNLSIQNTMKMIDNIRESSLIVNS